MDSFIDLFSNSEFAHILTAKSADYFETTREKYHKKTLSRFDQDFINNLFTNSGKTTEFLVILFNRDGGLVEKDRLNILSGLISEMVFGSKSGINQIWMIARFFSFIFQVKPYGFNFLAECSPNLTDLFPVEFEDFFKKKTNIFENVSFSQVPPIMEKLTTVLRSCFILFPYTYNTVDQSGIKFHSLIGERLSFNCVQIFGMAINQTIMFAKEFFIKKQSEIRIGCLENEINSKKMEIVKMKSENESLQKTIDTIKTDSKSLKHFVDKVKDNQNILIAEFEKYKKNIIEFTRQKNDQLERIQIENQKLKEDYEKSVSFMNNISLFIRSDEETRRELSKSLERSNMF